MLNRITEHAYFEWENTLNEQDKELVHKAFALMIKHFENFREIVPLKGPAAPKEYQCFLLDPTKKLCHIKDTLLFETDNLAHACSYIYNLNKKYNIECCVFQPLHQSYREYYRKNE